MKITIFLLLTFIAAASANADSFSVSQPTYGGTGCPAGTLGLSFDGGSRIQLYTDQFSAQSGDGMDRRIDRKSCNLAIPLHIPAGYQVALTSEVDGFVHADRSGLVRFNQELFFAGSQADRTTRHFRGPVSDNVQFDQSEASQWSPCGADVNLRANLNIMTEGNAYGSMDAMRFKIQWRRCH